MGAGPGDEERDGRGAREERRQPELRFGETQPGGVDRFQSVDAVEVEPGPRCRLDRLAPRTAGHPDDEPFGGHRHQSQPGSRHDAERALAAAQETGHVVARVVLEQPPEMRDDRPVGQNRLDPEEVGAHRAVAHHPHSAGVGGDHAAERRGVASAEIDTELPPGTGECAGQFRWSDAGPDRDLAGQRIDGADRLQPAQRQHDRTRRRHRAGHQTGVAALRHDGDAMIGTLPHDAGHFGGRARPYHRERLTPVPASPVDLVAGAPLGVGQNVVRADESGEGLEQAAHGGCRAGSNWTSEVTRRARPPRITMSTPRNVRAGARCTATASPPA